MSPHLVAPALRSGPHKHHCPLLHGGEGKSISPASQSRGDTSGSVQVFTPYQTELWHSVCVSLRTPTPPIMKLRHKEVH